MNEKTMVSDALVGVNGELKMFGEMIPQTENKELKQNKLKNNYFLFFIFKINSPQPHKSLP